MADGPVRFWLAVDRDDAVSLDAFAGSEEGGLASWRALVLPRFGYEGMHEYQNLLASVATAEWLVVIGDDAFCLTPGWDAKLWGCGDRLVANTENPADREWSRDHLMHFAIRRRWVEVTGRISACRHSDTYVTAVAKEAGLWNPEWVFTVGHVEEGAGPKDRVRDEVTAEIVYDSRLPMAEVKRDAALLRAAAPL